MNTEERIAKLEALVQQLIQGKYVFSDREEWTKTLKVPGLTLTNLNLSGTLAVTGTTNLKGAIQSNGTPGATTSFSTAATVTVNVQNGLITSVV